MSIQILNNTAGLNSLTDAGAVPISLSESAAQTSSLRVMIPGIPETNTGVWECTPGKFPRGVKAAEIMHILAGAATFTSTDGETVAFGAGDTVFFSPDTIGVWNVTETLRKLYIIIEPKIPPAQ